MPGPRTWVLKPLTPALWRARRAPLLTGAALRAGLGAPYLIAGALKSIYDLGLWILFRDVPLQFNRRPARVTVPRASGAEATLPARGMQELGLPCKSSESSAPD